jgi:predicted Zn-dependent protease
LSQVTETPTPSPRVSSSQEPKKTSSGTTYEQLNKGTSDTDESYRPKVSPCTQAMGYTIKTFDTRFGISKESFIETIEKSSAIWEGAVSKRLFYYDEKGPLTINLIYDERQEQTDIINNLAIEIENSKESANAIKAVHEAEKRTYQEDGQRLTTDTDMYEVRYKAYAAKVEMYNAQGGAPQDEYNAMAIELEQLKQEAKNLEARRDQLLKTMDLINAKVARYNELVIYINTLIKKSNSLGAAKFTEGRFVPRTNTVDIYQYNDKNKLLRVVTHELGHVLGINHNDNRYSIMYSFNSATTTTLSDDDKESLAKICGL